MADLKDFFGVEDEVVGGEEALDGGAVDFHFGAADADGTVADHAVAFFGFVHHFDAGDAGGGTALRSMATLSEVDCWRMARQ